MTKPKTYHGANAGEWAGVIFAAIGIVGAVISFFAGLYILDMHILGKLLIVSIVSFVIGVCLFVMSQP